MKHVCFFRKHKNFILLRKWHFVFDLDFKNCEVNNNKHLEESLALFKFFLFMQIKEKKKDLILKSYFSVPPGKNIPLFN